MKNKSAFARNLRRKMDEKKVASTRLCKEVGVSRAAIYKWLTGDFEPTRDNMRKLCDFFGCRPEDMWRETEKPVLPNDGSGAFGRFYREPLVTAPKSDPLSDLFSALEERITANVLVRICSIFSGGHNA